MPTFDRERLTEISVKNILPFIVIYVGVIFSVRLWDALAFVIAAFVLMAAMNRLTTVSFYALLIIPCLNVMNSVLFHKTFSYNLASKSLTLLLCLILIQQAASIRERYNVLRPFSWLLAYIALMLALSPFSLAPLVSLLKGLLFISFIGALIAMVSVMLQGQVHPGRARSVVLAVCCIFILGSLLVLPFPWISRSMLFAKDYYEGSNMLDTTFGLYNGITFHSQTLGPLLAILNAFLLSDYLFNLHRGGRLHQLLLCCIPVLVYLTSSRTALLTYVGSIFVIWLLLARSRHVPAGRKRFMHSLCAGGFLVITVGLVVSSGFRSTATDFLQKNVHHGEQGLNNEITAEALTSGRINMVDQQIESFRQHPLIGTGFQVSKELEERGITQWQDVLSSPIEKGFLPTMILEESGVIGGLLMFAFFVSVIRTFLVRSCYCFLGTFAAFLLTNLGEADFFSTSSCGGISWTICFCALLLDLHRIRYDQIRSRPQEAFGIQANWTFG